VRASGGGRRWHPRRAAVPAVEGQCHAIGGSASFYGYQGAGQEGWSHRRRGGEVSSPVAGNGGMEEGGGAREGEWVGFYRRARSGDEGVTARDARRGTVLTVYFGTPSMFIKLWFGFDYGTNPPLGTLII
jgi:hypothetical protein